jgi:hypothetical protein
LIKQWIQSFFGNIELINFNFQYFCRLYAESKVQHTEFTVWYNGKCITFQHITWPTSFGSFETNDFIQWHVFFSFIFFYIFYNTFPLCIMHASHWLSNSSCWKEWTKTKTCIYQNSEIEEKWSKRNTYKQLVFHMINTHLKTVYDNN